MKKVLFIGVTKYNLEKDTHFKKKFEGLGHGIKSHVLAKGKITLGRKIFGAEFYLLPPSFFFWIPATILACWLCLVKKIDVIVAQSPLMEGLVGTILKKIFKKELIVEIHGDWEVRKNLSKLAKIGLRNADKIRAVAQYLAVKSKKIAPDKPYFIFPTFTDLDEFLGEKSINFGNSVLLVGRNDPVKGVKYLVEAFAMVSDEFPNFKLVLVGDGLDSNYQLPITNYQFNGKIDLSGKVPLKEIKDIMKNCYCLVVPSISEGLPRVILEAMALAKPVIASRVGGIPELIKDGENGFLFEVGNVQELAEKLRILLSNKEMAIEMGRRGRELVQGKFSNEKYLENYINMIGSNDKLKKLLIITQKVDINDDNLGFFHGWLEKLAGKVDKLFVVCLAEGKHRLPPNVIVYSLGKERGYPKIRQFFRLQGFLLKNLPGADGIFVHMCPIYAVASWPLAKIFRKRMILWFLHRNVNWKLKLAEKCVDKILTVSEETCRLKNRKKIELMGHGIDTELFRPGDDAGAGQGLRILFVGRISPIKNLDTLIEGIDILVNQKNIKDIKVKIVGSPLEDYEKGYFEKLKRLIKEKKLNNYIDFLGGKTHREMVKFYQESNLFLNLSPTGGMDKAVLEAMACSIPALVSNQAFKKFFPKEWQNILTFKEKDAEDLAGKVINLRGVKQDTGLREVVTKHHNLDNLIVKIIAKFHVWH